MLEWKPEVTLTPLQIHLPTTSVECHQFLLLLAYRRVGLNFLILKNLGH